ncbi:MAG: hypothetical protein OMM_14696 [Candidatus Magnetoglobus multicellularis str. Araruama]|uniref:Uncharacterized protein n=1 Tax=Candidatus Magnetoglobus multicellularis str. Araruama TaxID=890399 RepID=A0A1V1NRF3_9BACT|nr:MAG: hypothetical protein OMM_14696 [Candidatus Magnetoglobus multicellularis str. Araruama]
MIFDSNELKARNLSLKGVPGIHNSVRCPGITLSPELRFRLPLRYGFHSGAVPLGRHKIIDNQSMINKNISTFHDKLIDNFFQDII